MKQIVLYASMALAFGLGASIAYPAQAITACERLCREDYTSCWYSCTPGQTWCYDLCAQNYRDCSAECG